MTLNDIIFIDTLPKIDLHGLDRETARVAILDFIKDCQKQKQAFFVVVHGIGSGILRKQTEDTLKRNKNVLEFRIFHFNMGCTLVHINV